MPKPPELLNPAQVCIVLGVSPESVKRLTREGYLEVKETVSFKNGDMQLFPTEQVRALVPKMPRIKQAWERYDNQRLGASRLALARIYRQRSYRDKVMRKNDFLQAVAQLPPEQEQIIKACYYLYHLNHYAKAGNPYLYDLKEAVLRTLVQNYYGSGNLLQVFFIDGESKVILCPECKAKAKSQRRSYLDYIDKTGGCARCTREYKYYSLYEFVIRCRDYRFCFHTPYAAARKWFKNGQAPPEKPVPRREGAYAFGRAIYIAEAQAVQLSEVIDELQKFLAAYSIPPLIDTSLRADAGT